MSRNKKSNLLGQTIGHLTVLKEAGFKRYGKSKQYQWECLCNACGKKTLRTSSSLNGARRNGSMASCGCRKRSVAKETGKKNRKDLFPGTRFSRLVIIKRGPNKGHITTYVCTCDCGNRTIVRNTQLTNGKTKSCGCLRKDLLSERRFKPIEPGTKFGRWTVIKKAPSKGDDRKRSVYACICECGKQKDVYAENLRGGKSISCGCYLVELKTTHGMSRTPEYKRWEVNKRRETKIKLGEGKTWKPAYERLLCKLQPECQFCGSKEKLTTDHIHPLQPRKEDVGGRPLSPVNALRLCVSCNSSKQDKTLDELEPEQKEKIIKATRRYLSEWEKKNGFIGGWVGQLEDKELRMIIVESIDDLFLNYEG